MKRTLGTTGVVVTLVGYVIGASIFILPGSLAATAGPAVVIAYLLAAVIAAFSCLAAGQLGSVFPNTGAGFIAVTRLLSPFTGFIGIWLMLAVYIMAIVLIALGFAEYFTALFPAFDATAVAFVVVALFTVLNMGKLDVLVRLQGILVLAFMVALAGVSIGGLATMDSANLTPFVPAGWNPVLLVAVPAFFSYGGFMAVMEMAGEIKSPGKTIPRGLILSFVLVVITYVALSLALVGMIPWQELASTKAPVMAVAERLFGGAGATFTSFAMMGAAATSINALVLVASRDIYALAQDGYLSGSVAGENSPALSVLIVGLCSLAGLALGKSITDYAVWVASFTLLFQILVGAALLYVPTRAAAAYDASPFKLGHLGIRLSGWGLILISAFFLIVVINDSVSQFAWAGVYFLLGAVAYRLRRKARETMA
ncbi:APC family permease [Kordiimonas aestuarii]|uniref:APC family permease n=1 Tax=Kordiimonas aestuarii TaxID=1005925 RepID=UPI0021D10008|nr:APC family permease [Kordiimonas aestuarii]